MDNFLINQEFEGFASASLSAAELENLVTTNFVIPLQNFQNDVRSSVDDCFEIAIQNILEVFELARAVGSPIHLPSPVAHGRLSDGLLEEYDCFRRSTEEKTDESDGPTLLLNRILQSLQPVLEDVGSWNVFEKTRKWKTSRDGELTLINSIISLVDARPAHLHIYCRRLTEMDIASIVEKALLTVSAPTYFRSLFRMTIKTEMPLKQFLHQLDTLYQFTPNMKVIEGRINAIQMNQDGTMQKFLTSEINKFAEMEHILCNTAFYTMKATARFVFGVIDRDHVLLAIEYHNEMDSCGKRAKSIMIEQIASLPANLHRRVTFGNPEVVQVHEYEISENAPFNPLGLSHRFQDLIHHLEKAPPSFGDAPKPSYYKNVTFR